MNIDNFCNLGAALQNKQIEVGKQPQIYFYRSNEDSIYEMLSEGYFNALNLRVAKDDLILLYSPKDEKKVFAKVVSNNGGIVQIMEISEDDFQHYEMPTPSIEYLNKIVQYIGNTTDDYTNGFFYKCVESSGNYIWENIIVQDSYLKSETYNKTEVDTELAKKLNTDGSNTFTGVLKMRSTVSFKGAVAPSWSGIGIYELKDDDSVSLMASMEKTDGFTPASNNTYNIGVNSRKWKDLYLAGKAHVPTINNGGDIAVPTSAGTMALTSDLTNFADKDLSNLTSQGKNIANWSSNVSNCITEIPQDIKLELNNGTLTLKAGSKVYNGNGLFAEVQTDTSLPSANYNGQVVVIYTSTDVLATAFMGDSVASLPSPSSSFKVYYNTTDKKCYLDTGSWLEVSFPIALATSTITKFTSIDQIFNGFGYIGSTVFALPGLKGLCPDGRNEDGTLKSFEFTISDVKTFSYNATGNHFIIIDKQENIAYRGSLAYYDEKENLLNNYDSMRAECIIGKCYLTSGVISNLEIKTPFHALDYNDTEYIASQSFPSDKYIDLTLGASGTTYTAPTDGYIQMIWDCGSGTSYITVNQPFNTDQVIYNANYTSVTKMFKVRKGNFTVNYANVTVSIFRFVYAKGNV